MLQNVIGGLQGVIDHVMVGHYVGYTGNAAIGVSWQIFLVVIVFISSVFTGMGVLVARFTGQGDADKVNRTVYQAFLTAAVLSVGVMAPAGYFLAPKLLNLVNAAPEVQAEALPYLRMMFVFSFGMMMFFMTGGAFRSAGDAQTPLRLGIVLTVLNIVLNVIFIRGLGPIPAYGTTGAAMGTVISGAVVSLIVLGILLSGRAVVAFRGLTTWKPDLHIVRELFRFGLPTGIQGVAMNLGGVFLLRFVGSLPESAEAQAVYRGELHAAVLVHHLDVGGHHGGDRGHRGAEPGRQQAGSFGACRARGLGDRAERGRIDRGAVPTDPAHASRHLRHARAGADPARRPTSQLPQRERDLHHRGTRVHRGAPGYR